MNKTLLIGLSLAAALLLIPDFALAAGDDEWVKPATDVIDKLRSGTVRIGAALLGLAIMGIGIYMGLSGRGEWGRLGYLIFAGFLITGGPDAIALLLEITS